MVHFGPRLRGPLGEVWPAAKGPLSHLRQHIECVYEERPREGISERAGTPEW